jgi:hypothetical protein
LHLQSIPLYGIGKGIWHAELVKPRSMGPTIESDSKDPLALEDAETENDWSAM